MKRVCIGIFNTQLQRLQQFWGNQLLFYMAHKHININKLNI